MGNLQTIIGIQANREDREERETLKKVLPPEYLQRPFSALLDYMGDNRQDQYNPTYDAPREISFAQRLQIWMRSARADENSTIRINYVRADGSQSEPIAMDELVGDRIGEMVRQDQVTTEHGPATYNRADLLIEYIAPAGRTH